MAIPYKSIKKEKRVLINDYSWLDYPSKVRWWLLFASLYFGSCFIINVWFPLYNSGGTTITSILSATILFSFVVSIILFKKYIGET